MKPKQIVIETSARCNLKCKGCYRGAGNSLNKDMDLGLFKSIIDRIDWDPTIVLFWNGEPLLNKDFYKMLTYVTDRNLRCYFCTNGTLLDSDVFLHAIRDNSCYQIFFSLNGLGSVNDLYRPGAATSTIERNIGRVRSWRDQYGAGETDIGVKLIDMGQDWDHIERFLLHWLQIADLVVVGKYWDSSLKVPLGSRRAPCAYATGEYMVIDADGWINLCEHHAEAPRIVDVRLDAPLPSLYQYVLNWNTLTDHPCSTCSMPYTGDGLYGQVRFKSVENHPSVFFQKDYYNMIFSLEEKRRGSRWSST